MPGAHGTAIGTGAANTTAIIAQNGAGVTYAAGLARAYAAGGYSDWCLPSKDELNQLYLNRAAIGGFHTAIDSPYYWSSSQDEGAGHFGAWDQGFASGAQTHGDKDDKGRVRAVRAFWPFIHSPVQRGGVGGVQPLPSTVHGSLRGPASEHLRYTKGLPPEHTLTGRRTFSLDRQCERMYSDTRMD